jgi:hypothetical protein
MHGFRTEARPEPRVWVLGDGYPIRDCLGRKPWQAWQAWPVELPAELPSQPPTEPRKEPPMARAAPGWRQDDRR